MNDVIDTVLTDAILGLFNYQHNHMLIHVEMQIEFQKGDKQKETKIRMLYSCNFYLAQ